MMIFSKVIARNFITKINCEQLRRNRARSFYFLKPWIILAWKFFFPYIFTSCVLMWKNCKILNIVQTDPQTWLCDCRLDVCSRVLWTFVCVNEMVAFCLIWMVEITVVIPVLFSEPVWLLEWGGMGRLRDFIIYGAIFILSFIILAWN